jgi:hypothetical protein
MVDQPDRYREIVQSFCPPAVSKRRRELSEPEGLDHQRYLVRAMLGSAHVTGLKPPLARPAESLYASTGGKPTLGSVLPWSAISDKAR